MNIDAMAREIERLNEIIGSQKLWPVTTAEAIARAERAEREREEAVALLRYVCSLHPDDCGCSGCKFAFLSKLEAKP